MSELKDIARHIFSETLAAIDIPATLERKIVRSGTHIRCGDALIDLAAFRQVRVVAFGKAAYAMASGLVEQLAPDVRPVGILVTPSPAPRQLVGFQMLVAGHPVPTARSFAAGRAILDLLATCDGSTLVIFLLSGGGSALVELPLDPSITLDDLQTLYRLLVTCGGSIDEINAVRKHLSAVKGGRLAAVASLATKLTYGVSDVPVGRESALASGPTLPDPTTVPDAYRIVAQYDLLGKLPPRLRTLFERRALLETPKPGDPAFVSSHFELLLGMHDLFHQAHRVAEACGFITICDNSTDDWPLEQSADFLLDQLTRLRQSNPGRRVAIVADGEVSSPVTGDGIGGRNSAFVLNCVEKIAGLRVAVISAGTDGVDGNSPAAGAVADGESLGRAHAIGLAPRDSFHRSDAYNFFRLLGDAIETGPTGNNLRDLRILLAE